MLGIVQVAASIGSDSEQSRVLLEVVTTQPIDSATRQALHVAAGRIGSDHHRSRVVSAMLSVTDYYRRYPVVLVRLSRIDRNALRDLLSVSWRLALAKTRPRGRTRRHGGSTTIRESSSRTSRR